MLATFCALDSLSRRCAALDKAANSFSSRCFAVADAHAALATFCEFITLKHRSAALAKAAASFSSVWLTVANAHAVLEIACALTQVANAHAVCLLDLAVSAHAVVANAHAVLAVANTCACDIALADVLVRALAFLRWRVAGFVGASSVEDLKNRPRPSTEKRGYFW